MSILIQNVPGIFPDCSLRGCDVYIQAGLIAGIDAPPQNFKAERVVDGAGKLLIPGLVNSHTHSYMTLLRNVADDLKFHDWLFGKILPLEERLTPEDCYWGTQLGILEMLRTGTTCFADMYIFKDAAAEAVTDAGARAVLSRGLACLDADKADGARRLQEAADEVAAWSSHDNLSFMLAPHAAYTCDPGYQREVAAAARQLNVGIHTHISESTREVAEITAQYGKSPVALMAENNLLTSRTLAAHCVHLDTADIALLAAQKVSVAHNPVSNLKLANGCAPVPDLMAAGVNVCLGTDGAASNNTLNLFGDLRMATLLHKGISGNPETVTAAEGFVMATQNGARALGLSDKIGQLAVGFAADLVLLDMNLPQMQPQNNPLAALSYSASGHEVCMSMINGQILYENGTYPTMDAERILHEVRQICKRIGTLI